MLVLCVIECINLSYYKALLNFCVIVLLLFVKVQLALLRATLLTHFAISFLTAYQVFLKVNHSVI